MADVKPTEELDFTLQKIQQNFSNFSSWYYRSCLYTLLSAKVGEDLLSKNWNQEYELVENAIFTDPSDQSPWFYHKWLTSTNCGKKVLTRDQSFKIIKVIFHKPSSKLSVVFTNPVPLPQRLTITIDGVVMNFSQQKWVSVNSHKISCLWTLKLKENIKSIVISGEFFNALEMKLNNLTDLFVWNDLVSQTNNEIMFLQDSHLSSLQCLLDMEQDNKCKLAKQAIIF